MKMMRVHITLWLVLLLGGFAAGFIPEYLKNRDLRAELESPQKTIESLKLQLQMSELRDQASLMLLELSRQNYGLARDYSGQLRNKLKDAISTVQDPALKKSLQDLASAHDAMESELATASASAVTASQPLVLKAFEVTRNVK